MLTPEIEDGPRGPSSSHSLELGVREFIPAFFSRVGWNREKTRLLVGIQNRDGQARKESGDESPHSKFRVRW